MAQPEGRVGKRVGGAVYVHRSACALLGAEHRDLVSRAEAFIGKRVWSVAKIPFCGGSSVSLLDYEPFEEAAFPALRQSHTVNLVSGTVTSRRYSADNPPILHRKELLLPPGHPDRALYTKLTELLEQRGLFVEMSKRGRRQPWNEALANAGLTVDGHVLSEIMTDEVCSVQRHRTAIARDTLSAPMAALWSAGILSEKYTLLDYGCGRGDDVRILTDAGIAATGWDPYFRPDQAALVPHDIVNLGFVINVVEDPIERKETLRRAFALSRRCLAVSVMLVGKGDVTGLQPHGDGFLTQRKTFQKYYTQAEIRNFIELTLEVTPVAAAPGVFLAFRDEPLEQAYLSRRQLGHVTPRIPSAGRMSVPDKVAQDSKVRAAQVEKLAELMLELGRAPYADELPNELARTFAKRRISIGTAIIEAAATLTDDEVAVSAMRRREDVQRFFALRMFSGRASYRELSPALKRDVRTFFGTLQAAEAAGRDLLFSSGDMMALRDEAALLHAAGRGQLIDDKYQIHVRDVSETSNRFKTFVSIGETLAGSFSEATVFKLHLTSRKLTALQYDDFSTAALPRLTRRTKVDLKTGDVLIFDHTEESRVNVLLHKSRYMGRDDPGRNVQLAFDAQVEKVAPANQPPPKFSDFARALLKAGILPPS